MIIFRWKMADYCSSEASVSHLATDSCWLALVTTAILAATVCGGAEDSRAHGAQQKLQKYVAKTIIRESRMACVSLLRLKS